MLLIYTSAPTNNNISVKKYDQKKVKTKTWKWKLKGFGTLKLPVIVGALDMIKKVTDNTLTGYLPVLADMKSKKFHFAEQVISFGEYCQCN